jgi:hypothetical protein
MGPSARLTAAHLFRRNFTDPAPPPSPAGNTRAVFLWLQRTAGNTAVTGLVSGRSVQRLSLWDWIRGDPFRDEKAMLRKLFGKVVEKSRQTSTIIAVPAEYQNELIEFASEGLAEDRMLMDALDRGPRFHKGGAILDLQPGAAAMTLDQDVFVRDHLDVETYVHELVHVAQYGQLGALRFLTLYFGETVARLAWHLLYDVPFDEFRASALERQAYAVEERFKRWRADRWTTREPSLRKVTTVPSEEPLRRAKK